MNPLPKANSEPHWLERLPFAAVLVDAKLRVQEANSEAETILTALDGSAEIATAVARAIGESRMTRLGALTLGHIAVSRGWVAPDTDGALVLLDLLPDRQPAEQYTQLSSTMAAMMAHEIRNPLLSITGAAQLLALETSGENKELCQLIVKEVGRLDQLIATLDPLSPTPARVMKALNIHEVLEHARLATEAACDPAIRFVVEYDPSLPEIRGESTALVQLFLNLLKNAAEAVEGCAAPTITLTTRTLLGETRRNSQGVALPMAVSIADNGPGISPTIMERLFAPFTTTKPTGKGLGLAIVARIAEEHGGQITVDSGPSGGARFTLYLPLAANPASTA